MSAPIFLPAVVPWLMANEYYSIYVKGKPVNLVHVWSGLLALKTSNSGRDQLVPHILSIVAISGNEPLFNEMGSIHAKRRV